MAKAVKLADIADKLGVSKVTVSKALSGQKGVGEDLRRKIIDLADEMGYKSPSAIKNNKYAKSYNLAVIIQEKHFDKYDSFYMQMYKQVNAKALSKSSYTMLEVVSQQMEDKGELPRLIQDEKVDGIIIIGMFATSYLRLLKAKAKVPIVYMDFIDENEPEDSVISDSFYGSFMLTNYLYDCGHTRIAYVGTLLSTDSITDRYLGYVKALMEHGKGIDDIIVINDRDINKAAQFAPELLKLPKKLPTAFVCNCDKTAGVLIKRLEMDGYKIPDDISVVGYDNYIFPGTVDVDITTYEVDIKEMARQAVNIVIAKISGETYRSGTRIVEGRMVIKNSVRKIK